MIAAIASLGMSVWLCALPAQASPDDPPQATSSQRDDPLADARKASDREDWDLAAEKFRAFLAPHPNAPQAAEARFWEGFCRVKLDENEQAVEILLPFTDALAADKWADNALLQIGKAYRGLDQESDALAAWKRHLEKYPRSLRCTRSNASSDRSPFRRRHRPRRLPVLLPSAHAGGPGPRQDDRGPLHRCLLLERPPQIRRVRSLGGSPLRPGECGGRGVAASSRRNGNCCGDIRIRH